jgi:hypothetical protein
LNVRNCYKRFLTEFYLIWIYLFKWGPRCCYVEPWLFYRALLESFKEILCLLLILSKTNTARKRTDTTAIVADKAFVKLFNKTTIM